MYALILIIAVQSPAPIRATSQLVGKFESLDQCKEAASKPAAGGAIVDLNLSRGVYWYCAYAGTK